MAALPDVLPAGPVELRRCRLTHLDALMDAIGSSQADLARWLPWADPMPTREAERSVIEHFDGAFDADADWSYFLFEPDGSHLVGGAGLHPRGDGVAEIGYWVRSDRTGRGFATAAARALTDAAFQHLPDLRRVVIRMDQANFASAAVPRNLGYRLEGAEDREAVTSGHTGAGWIWMLARPAP